MGYDPQPLASPTRRFRLNKELVMRRIPLCGSLAACLLLNVASVFSQYASESPIVHQQARRTTASLPVVFEANRGQADPRVHFLGRGTGYTLFLTPTETMFVEAKTAVGSRRNGRNYKPIA